MRKGQKRELAVLLCFGSVCITGLPDIAIYLQLIIKITRSDSSGFQSRTMNNIESITVYVPSLELVIFHPLSLQRVCPFPQNRRGEHTCQGVRGWAVPIPATGEKFSTLPSLCSQTLKKYNKSGLNVVFAVICSDSISTEGLEAVLGKINHFIFEALVFWDKKLMSRWHLKTGDLLN